MLESSTIGVFTYAADQQIALLDPLKIKSDIRQAEIVNAVTRAARDAITNHEIQKSAPDAPDIIEKLNQFEHLATDVESYIGDMGEVVQRARNAQRDLSGDGPFGQTYMLNGVLTYRESKGRKSRAGRTPNQAVTQCGLDLALIFFLVTSQPPKISKNKETGQAYGRFCEFLEAAVRPTGLLKKGRRIDARAVQARRDFKNWREAVTCGKLADVGVTSEKDALPMVAERLGITLSELSG